MTAQKVVHLQSNLNPSHDGMQTEAENDDYCVFPHKHIDLWWSTDNFGAPSGYDYVNPGNVEDIHLKIDYVEIILFASSIMRWELLCSPANTGTHINTNILIKTHLVCIVSCPPFL